MTNMDDMDKLFSLRVRLTNAAHGATTLAIVAYDGHHQSRDTGHSRIDVRACLYTTTPEGKRTMRTIWKRGQTWCAVNSSTCIDSVEAKSLVLSLFSMKPGDTDAEYFEGWTAAQLAFADSYGETLSMEREYRYGED